MKTPFSAAVRDFIETHDGILLAVVGAHLEDDRVLCFPRYLRSDAGLEKLPASQAMQVLEGRFPDYLYHSQTHDVTLAGIRTSEIAHVYDAVARAAELIKATIQSNDIELSAVASRCGRLLKHLQETGTPLDQVGITGSLLVGAEGPNSDLDLVAYAPETFLKMQQFVRSQIELHPIPEALWQETYRRRNCSLPFDEYLWHELRKANKMVWEGSKVDISLVATESNKRSKTQFTKQRQVQVTARIVDDKYSFHSPARWHIDCELATTLICNTATFVGQAQLGEQVEISGWLEESSQGNRQIVVGTSREAPGEWIRVLQVNNAKQSVQQVRQHNASNRETQ